MGKNLLDSFLNHLNDIHSLIKFTLEIANEYNLLPLLNVVLSRKSGPEVIPSTVSLHILRRYLNYLSFLHPKIKSPVFGKRGSFHLWPGKYKQGVRVSKSGPEE